MTKGANRADGRALAEVLNEAGYEVTLTPNGHYRISGEGLPSVFMPSTPSENRGIKNVCHQLRRSGYVFTFRGKEYRR